MKLTKAQRLFIKAGEQQAFMKIYSNRGHFRAAHRKARKKLIREALEAARHERTDAFNDGVWLAMQSLRKSLGEICSVHK